VDTFDSELIDYQRRIREQLAAVRDADLTTGAGKAKARAVLELTAEMLAYEEDIPTRRGEQERRRLRPQVRIGGLAVAGSGVLLILCAVAGWISAWRIVFAVPLIVVGIAAAIDPFGQRTLGARQPVDGPGWRAGAMVGAGAALAVLLTGFGVSWWLLLVSILLGAVALVLLSRASAPPPLPGRRQ
jgi:hypothetical protein